MTTLHDRRPADRPAGEKHVGLRHRLRGAGVRAVGSQQSASSIAGCAGLPLILLVVGHATGVMLLGPVLFAVLGVVLAALDVLLVRWIIVTFDRGKVVTSFL
ncbi:MAG: hypothetical protein ACJ72B_01280 [Ornithinibacter sp.]